MSFIDDIKQKAKREIKTIVLPEGGDLRVLKAVDTILKEKFANIILIGDEKEVTKLANENMENIKKSKKIEKNY